ncbi:uncharacterized protein LOC134221293 [Armigeres subalbatus]|uniref:uncharacterized protein LOC134221293 n=1 Tax=Armigeres subalbatus TaxID=124917 RepID=UPI002ED24D33
MVRAYRRSDASRTYSVLPKDVLSKCLADVKAGRKTIVAASKEYHISRQTIYNKLNNVHNKSPGHQRVFSKEEEQSFADHLSLLSEWGFPVGTGDLREIVRIYLKKQNREILTFVDNKPGKDWVSRFLRDHSELSKRFAQNIKVCRADISRETIRTYMDHLRRTIEGIPPQNIFNYDETNLADDPGKKLAICKRGLKYFENVQNFSKSSTSVMFCGNATGNMIPPYVVFKSECLWDSWTQNGPKGTRFNRTSSGWFDEHVFEDWFNMLFLPAIRHLERPVALIGDNLSSHINPAVIKKCQEENIKFICLPPNTTHLTQPLDVAFFGPMKREWRKILSTWRNSREGAKKPTIPKERFAFLLNDLTQSIAPRQKQILRSGFRKCGIYPLNVEQLLSRFPPLNADTSLVGDSFKEFLVHQRANVTGHENETKRKRKLKVDPGKGITPDDIQKAVLKDRNTVVPAKKKRKK